MSSNQYRRDFLALGQKKAEPTVGDRKRKRSTGPQVSFVPNKAPCPAGGISFTTGTKPRGREALTDATMTDAATDAPKSKAQLDKEEHEERELLLKEFLDENDDDQAPFSGSIRIIKSGPPGYVSWRLWRKELANDQPLAVEFQRRKREGKAWAWVQIYGNPSPKQKDADRLVRAIAHAATLELAAGLDPTAFSVRVIRKSAGRTAPTLLVFAENKKQCGLLTALGNFEFQDTEGSAIFFAHGGEKPASAIILDIKNGPQDVELLMKGCLRAFYDAIKWKAKDGKKLIPAHFAYAKVEGLKTQAGEKGTTWRVAFEPDHSNVGSWKYQGTVGIHGDKGEVGIHRPPFCEMCISHSHQTAVCNWWTMNNTRTEAKMPGNYVKLKWNNRSAFNSDDLPVGAELVTGGPETEGQPDGPTDKPGSPATRAMAPIREATAHE